MEKDHWIVIKEVSASNLVGMDEFIAELRKDYHVQYGKRWLPAACEGTELWMSIFSNMSLETFIASSLVGGAVYDVFKRFALSPLKDALKKLYEKNEGNLSFQTFELVFDDIKIKIEGLLDNAISTVSIVFQELVKAVPYLHSKGIDNIIEIRLPIMLKMYYDEDKCLASMETEDGSIYLWRVDYNYGCSRLLFDVKNKEKAGLY